MKPTFNNKAPRLSKKDFSTQIFTKELFENFKKEFPEYKDMKWDFFKSRWLEIAETIRNEWVMNPLGVKLNYYLGEGKTQFLPSNFKGVDRNSTIQNGEFTNHLNILTRGKVAKIKWERRWAIRFNRMLEFFAFEPDRKMKQIAKIYIPDNMDKIRVSRMRG